MNTLQVIIWIIGLAASGVLTAIVVLTVLELARDEIAAEHRHAAWLGAIVLFAASALILIITQFLAGIA